MLKRQKTLRFFCFSKEITHRWKRLKIELPEDVPKKSKNVECSICKNKFFNTQGLGVHKFICSQDYPQYATAETNKHVAPTRTRQKAESVVEKVQSVVNYLVETAAVGDHSKEVKDKKKATWESNVRKKHTYVFKAKVIYQVQDSIIAAVAAQISIENLMQSKENQLYIRNYIDYFLITLK